MRWFIPSATVLFVAVGYVVHSAQRDFLGIEIGGNATSEYVATAAAFFADLVTIAADLGLRVLSLRGGPSFGGHATELMLGTLLAVALWIVVAVSNRRRPTRIASYLIAIALLALVSGKFILLDAPLTFIDSVVVGVGEETGGATRVGNIDDRLAAAAGRNDLRAIIAARARATWTDIVCSRISKSAIERVAAPGSRDRCRDERASEARIVGEFVAHSYAALLLIVTSAVLLRRTPFLTAAATVALLYGLMWPYAYGKLIKSTAFEYGLVVFKSPPFGDAVPPTDQEKELHAVILSADDHRTMLLAAESRTCAGSPASRSRTVKLWEVPNSEIAFVREIYREDVITWRTLNEQPCPSTGPPL